jgi:hypothetical protein
LSTAGIRRSRQPALGQSSVGADKPLLMMRGAHTDPVDRDGSRDCEAVPTLQLSPGTAARLDRRLTPPACDDWKACRRVVNEHRDLARSRQDDSAAGAQRLRRMEANGKPIRCAVVPPGNDPGQRR